MASQPVCSKWQSQRLFSIYIIGRNLFEVQEISYSTSSSSTIEKMTNLTRNEEII